MFGTKVVHSLQKNKAHIIVKPIHCSEFVRKKKKNQFSFNLSNTVWQIDIEKSPMENKVNVLSS